MQDAMETALDLAGGDQSGIDFKSLLPLMKGNKEKQYDAIYGAFTPDAQRTVIDGDHKLILYPKGKVALLYDLAKDPLEKSPIANGADAEAIKKRLFAKLRTLQKETGDQLDLASIYPQWKKATMSPRYGIHFSAPNGQSMLRFCPNSAKKVRPTDFPNVTMRGPRSCDDPVR